jgi:DNA-binding transcriptional LysR family regulator
MTGVWPDLAVLELLVAVGERGSLGAAARAVGIAQPNASRSISRLEHLLGVTLIRRSPSGSTLTTEGKVVVHWAREVLTSAEHLVVGAQALRMERRSHLTVGASMTVAEYLVPLWLGEFRRQHPDVQVNLEVHNSYEVFDRISAGHCQLGFVESPSIPSSLHSVVVARDRLVVVVDPSHPWARRRKPLRVAELAATSLIVREPGSGTRITLDTMLSGHDVAPPLLELGSNSAVKISVRAGVAPAVLSKLAVDADVRSGTLREVPVDDLDLSRRLCAVWRSPRRLASPASDLVNIARRAAAATP